MSRTCGHYGDNHGRSLAPLSGLEGGLLSRYVAIMARRPPSGSHHGGWRAAFCPDICACCRSWPPSGSITGLDGGLLSQICDHYGDDHAALQLPLWGWRAAFCPGYATIMTTTMARNMPTVLASTKQHIDVNNIKMIDHMLPKELRSVATQLDPIQEASESKATWCECWSGLRRLFSLRWYRPREISCIIDEFFTP